MVEDREIWSDKIAAKAGSNRPGRKHRTKLTTFDISELPLLTSGGFRLAIHFDLLEEPIEHSIYKRRERDESLCCLTPATFPLEKL
jgi:hypothetical protein